MDRPPRFVIRLTMSSARVFLGSLAGGLLGARLGGVGGAFLGGFIGTFLLCLVPGPARVDQATDPEEGEGGFDDNGLPQGPWLWRYADGQPKHEVHYDLGVAEGFETYWYPSGRKEIQCRRVGGKREGESSFYHPNGELASRGRFSGDSKEGEWSYYDADGNLVRTCTYAANQLQGPSITFHPDGEPAVDEAYAAGLPHGLRVESPGSERDRTETLLVGGVPVPTRGRAKFRLEAGSQVSGNGWFFWGAMMLFLATSFARDPSIGVGLILIAVAIGLHEFGHLVGGWLVGIPIETFRVGIGPTILRARWGVTTYELGLIPVLGFVRPYEIRRDDWALYRSIRQLVKGSPAGFAPTLPPPDAPAGQELRPVSDFVPRPKRLVYLLAGIAVNLAIWATLHVAVRGPEVARHDLPILTSAIIESAPEAVAESFRPSTYESDEPGAVSMLGDIARKSWRDSLIVFGIINFCLAVFNALPIPPLDGFSVLVVSIEMLTRREVPRRVLTLIMVAGVLLLCVLAIASTLGILRDVTNAVRR